MPLFKSSHQQEREQHNREMIDRAQVDGSHRGAGVGYGAQQPPQAYGTQPHPAGLTNAMNDHRTWDQVTPSHNHPGGTEIPPAEVLSGQSGHGNSGSGSGRTTGKVEAAIGSAVGSHSLKAKGLQKQYEADALQRQTAELSEAERLENEAHIRRERAVAHGAHPQNLHQGAGLN
ncbi:hypothetical protein DFP72DRAFT_871310 [Ephemerocybe angulata]|uniref:Uncharacterized protein n=1 Tax=Ephemerocybe angulata TaxID=980116 RepID=A0A8H6MG61_9AGAR|nr:hypothetical protein DFP72DRAFT_871310 [Tulosesus angulatus]